MRTSNFLGKLKWSLPAAFVALGLCLSAAPVHAEGTFFPRRAVVSDFDGDHQLDQAHLSSNGSRKQIHINLEKSFSKTLSFDSGMLDPGNLVSADIDRDGDADLVWLSQTAAPTIKFWMGDGHGNFTFITDPVTQSRLTKEFLRGNTSW